MLHAVTNCIEIHLQDTMVLVRQCLVFVLYLIQVLHLSRYDMIHSRCKIWNHFWTIPPPTSVSESITAIKYCMGMNHKCVCVCLSASCPSIYPSVSLSVWLSIYLSLKLTYLCFISSIFKSTVCHVQPECITGTTDIISQITGFYIIVIQFLFDGE